MITFLLFGCIKEQTNLENLEAKQDSTKYDKALRKMNNMVAVFNEKSIGIAVTSIENKTSALGKLPQNITTMVNTSFNNMGNNIINIYNAIAIPDTNSTKDTYYIYGAIIKYDTLESSRKGREGGISGSYQGQSFDGDGSVNYENSMSNIGISFNVSSLKKGIYLPRVSTTNEIKIQRKSNGNDFGFSILGTGFGINNDNMKSHGVHEALNILVNFSAIELIGKIGNLPYWLLTNGKPNQDIISYLGDKFYQLPLHKKIKQISYMLSLQNSNIRVTNTITKELSQAIINYKKKHNIKIVDNSISHELYLKILGA